MTKIKNRLGGTDRTLGSVLGLVGAFQLDVSKSKRIQTPEWSRKLIHLVAGKFVKGQSGIMETCSLGLH
jgi:hypothetical protein